MNEFLNNAWDFVKKFWYIIVLVAGIGFVGFVLFVKPVAARRKIVYRRSTKKRASGKSKSVKRSGRTRTKTKTKGKKGVLRIGRQTYPNTVEGRKAWSRAMARRRKAA